MPADLGQALEMLKQYGPDARVIAGGTDLLPKVKAGVVEFGHLVSLKELKELTAVRFDESGALHIGATALLGDLERMVNRIPDVIRAPGGIRFVSDLPVITYKSADAFRMED